MYIYQCHFLCWLTLFRSQDCCFLMRVAQVRSDLRFWRLLLQLGCLSWGLNFGIFCWKNCQLLQGLSHRFFLLLGCLVESELLCQITNFQTEHLQFQSSSRRCKTCYPLVACEAFPANWLWYIYLIATPEQYQKLILQWNFDQQDIFLINNGIYPVSFQFQFAQL